MPVDVMFEVHLLNLRYRLRGFTAIKELKEWLDEHASEGYNVCAPAPPAPNTVVETPTRVV